MSHPFQPRTPRDVEDLITAQPLAWVVSRTGDGLRGTTLPLLVRTDTQGAVTELVGHFARANSQLAELRRDPRALILFLGPNGYISPTLVSDRTWAPTWNFAHAQFQVELDFFEAPEAIADHLRELVTRMENGRPNAWSVDEMGERFARLSRGVIGFHARVLHAEARFKLGQDERPEVFDQIVRGLGDDGLKSMMEAIRRPSQP